MIVNLRRAPIAVALVWAILTMAVLPWLVSEAYAGRGIDVLNRILASRMAENPLGHYLTKIYVLAVAGVAVILAAGFGLPAAARDAARGSPVARRFVLPASAASLAGIRIGTVAVALIMLLLEDPASVALLPRWSEVSWGMGIMNIARRFPGVEALLASAGALLALKALTVTALLLALVGLWTRAALVLSVVGTLALGAVLRMYTHFFHTGLLPIYLLAILSLCRCADAWSVDCLLRRRAGKPVPAPERPTMDYGWARFVCWSMIALAYFAAGTSKLRHGGLFWWDGVNLKTKLLTDVLQVNSIELFWTSEIGRLPTGLFSLLGLGTLVIEVGFIAVLFSRRARLLFPLGAAGLHIGVFLMQEILFLDLILIQIVFFDVRRLAVPLERWARSRWPALGAGEPTAPLAASEPAPPADAPATASIRPMMLSLIPLACLGVTALALESYPLTTWGMYSDRTRSTRVEYILFHGVDEAGRKVPVRFEDAFGVLRFNRCYDIVPRAFQPGREQILRDLLDAFAQIRDRGRLPGDRLAAFQFDLRAWDYDKAPRDSQRGAVVASFVHRVGPAAAHPQP
jgi:hypothetical protein